MTRTLSVARRAAIVGLITAFGLASPRRVAAQSLGPSRPRIALEAYVAHLELDPGGVQRAGLNGIGGRVWVSLLSHAGIAGFMTYAPPQGTSAMSVLHYGGQIDVFPWRRPLAGFLDPFVTVGAGAFRTATALQSATQLAVSSGVGIRIPMPHRLQLRADAHDAFVAGNFLGDAAGEISRTTNNLEIMLALGVTF